MKTIRELREERGWSQYELAVKLGVHPSTVYEWERGRKMPKIPQFRKLAQVFSMPMEEIEILEPEGKVAA
jgi:transcriptional regulator with XRE-family HTH domain